MNSQREYWFPKKRFGWGWGLPLVWQGWICLAIYVAGLSLTFHFLRPALAPMAFGASVTLLTLLLVAVFLVKGEPLGRGLDR